MADGKRFVDGDGKSSAGYSDELFEAILRSTEEMGDSNRAKSAIRITLGKLLYDIQTGRLDTARMLGLQRTLRNWYANSVQNSRRGSGGPDQSEQRSASCAGTSSSAGSVSSDIVTIDVVNNILKKVMACATKGECVDTIAAMLHKDRASLVAPMDLKHKRISDTTTGLRDTKNVAMPTTYQENKSDSDVRQSENRSASNFKESDNFCSEVGETDRFEPDQTEPKSHVKYVAEEPDTRIPQSDMEINSGNTVEKADEILAGVFKSVSLSLSQDAADVPSTHTVTYYSYENVDSLLPYENVAIRRSSVDSQGNFTNVDSLLPANVMSPISSFETSQQLSVEIAESPASKDEINKSDDAAAKDDLVDMASPLQVSELPKHSKTSGINKLSGTIKTDDKRSIQSNKSERSNRSVQTNKSEKSNPSQQSDRSSIDVLKPLHESKPNNTHVRRRKGPISTKIGSKESVETRIKQSKVLTHVESRVADLCDKLSNYSPSDFSTDYFERDIITLDTRTPPHESVTSSKVSLRQPPVEDIVKRGGRELSDNNIISSEMFIVKQTSGTAQDETYQGDVDTSSESRNFPLSSQLALMGTHSSIITDNEPSECTTGFHTPRKRDDSLISSDLGTPIEAKPANFQTEMTSSGTIIMKINLNRPPPKVDPELAVSSIYSLPSTSLKSGHDDGVGDDVVDCLFRAADCWDNIDFDSKREYLHSMTSLAIDGLMDQITKNATPDLDFNVYDDRLKVARGFLSRILVEVFVEIDDEVVAKICDCCVAEIVEHVDNACQAQRYKLQN